MRPVAALAAVVVAVLTALMVGSPAEAAAPGGLRLELADVSPRVVTVDGPTTLTVTGTLVNDGPTPVTDLQVRVQRGNPLTTEGQVRDALDGEAAVDAVTPQFLPLTDVLEPGDQVPVRLTVPLRGSPQTGLALAATGVHELLVNVNGTPEGGARARLAAVRMLVPVLGLPGVTAKPRGDPAPLTVLYPVADVPHRIATVPGDPVLLDDDTLAASFATTGRLGGLVAALAQSAPLGSPVRASLCLAVDPDLVETASVMSQGYRVVGPNGTTSAGTGAAAAGQWLTQLQAVAKGGCVVALPYADADLVALRRGGLTDAATRALTSGRQILTSLLQTPVTDIAWPADGLADAPTLDLLQSTGTPSVLLSADAVTGRARGGVVPLADRPMEALLTDPLLTRAATAPQDSPVTPGPGAAANAESLAGDGGPLATQDLIGALDYRAASGTPLVLAPPHQWAADGTGARDLLDAVGTLIGAGDVVPTALTDAVAAGSDAPAVRPDPPAGAAEVPAAAVGTVAAAARDLTDLRTAVVESGVGITSAQLFAPLDLGLLRGASAARRGEPGAAQSAATAVLSQVAAVRNSVRVLEPPNPYSLGTADAPLPITIANALPVTVKVRIEITSTSGLRVAPIETQQVPPLGRRQVSVNAQVTRAGQFTVEAAVRTPAGELLGPPSRLRVRSTAYGTITGWLTAIAGGLLVLLAARRIWRRVRGEPARPTARVDPTPPPTEPSTSGSDRETATASTLRTARPDPQPCPTAAPVPPWARRPMPEASQTPGAAPVRRPEQQPAAPEPRPVAAPEPTRNSGPAPGPPELRAPRVPAAEDLAAAPTERLPRPSPRPRP